MVVTRTLARCRVVLEVIRLPIWLALPVQPYHSLACGTERSLLAPFDCLVRSNELFCVKLE